VAEQSVNLLCFQQARTLYNSSLLNRPLASIHYTRPSEPETLLLSETPFTAGNGVIWRLKSKPARAACATRGKSSINYPSFLFIYYALVILIGTVLSCPQVMSASDGGGAGNPSSPSKAPSASSTTSASPAPEVSLPKSDKYDVDHIGQRGVGHGVNVYSMQRERAMGEAMASAIDRGTRFVTDPDVNSYVSRLVQNVARHSDAEVPFSIKVIDSPDSRIFGLPGGFLYVDKGLIQEVDSEAELAALMAHEIAHVAARHATRFATRKHAWRILSIPLMMASGPAALGTQQIVPLSLRKFSRDAEIEADLLGIEYQYATGYDPEAFVEALKKLSGIANRSTVKVSGKTSLHDQIARAFANYPPTEDRIQRLQAAISMLLPPRNDYVLDTSEFHSVKAKIGDRPILRRARSGESLANGPVLRRAPSLASPNVATGSLLPVTKGRLSPVFSYLPALQ
jgi:Zn-dependent protease with chaperone function